MKTIKMKLITGILACSLFTAMVIGWLAIMNSTGMSRSDARDRMQLTGRMQTGQINSTIQKIEQSVNTLSELAMQDFDFASFQKSKAYADTYTKLIEEKHIVFSDDAKQQMEEMKMICEKMFHNISKIPEDTQEWLQKVHDSENFIDQKTEEFYESHLERINRGECNDEACIIFSEMLTDFERIGDHTWNVAKQIAKIIERG